MSWTLPRWTHSWQNCLLDFPFSCKVHSTHGHHGSGHGILFLKAVPYYPESKSKRLASLLSLFIHGLRPTTCPSSCSFRSTPYIWTTHWNIQTSTHTLTSVVSSASTAPPNLICLVNFYSFFKKRPAYCRLPLAFLSGVISHSFLLCPHCTIFFTYSFIYSIILVHTFIHPFIYPNI